MQEDDSFGSSFRTLTKDGPKDGYEPLRWQRRLFEEYFRQNRIPKVCDLPTGLGKTSVIHLWLIALGQQMREGKKERLPTRLVYVVDRRTVVDQATTLAERIKENLGLSESEISVAVSTLRGHLADNREWTADPSRPAIIIGTVDMIGSRLLFSGYRSSYKLRPLDAGLLGQDTLLILDEAHLSEPFAKLIREISDRGRFQRKQGSPMRVMCMSATTSGDDPDRFKLEASDLVGDAETNLTVKRYEAKKWLKIELVAERSALERRIAETAVDLAEDGSRVVVFVRRPEDAVEIAKAIRGYSDRKRKQLKPFQNSVEVLTGTMRGLERDELIERPVLKRFLDGDEKPEHLTAKAPAVLVSTSAGEVGFDLNADHMVCDATPLDSMIQRLGRVNRRGHRDATVRVFVAEPDEKRQKRKRSPGKSTHTFDSAVAETIKCLENLRKTEADGTRDASPKAIDELKERLTKERPELLVAAGTPKPATVELTDILLDAWSMTTITEPMPGRPPVAAWLRGTENAEPQTTIAWRAELDLDGFDQLDTDDIEEWFDAHPVLVHETLSIPTSKAAKWVLERWDKLSDAMRESIGDRPCIIDRAGLQILKLKKLVEELERKRTDSIIDAEIVFPAAFGGIERCEGLPNESRPDEAAPDSIKAPDVADARGRYRVVRTVDDKGEHEAGLVGALPDDTAGLARFVLDLPSVGDTRRQLESLVPQRERLDFGTQKRRLWHHVGLVRKHARDLVERLGISGEIGRAVELAAAWHDHGKDRDIWQGAAGRKRGERALGKSGEIMQRIPGSYRHEFGSIREFIDAQEGKLSDDMFQLAAHLIASHHGRARPHFPKGAFDPVARSRSPEIAADVICRFARLQRKYGYWQLAWLENLLRCVDAMASVEDK